jgi:hypothetical protein
MSRRQTSVTPSCRHCDDFVTSRHEAIRTMSTVVVCSSVPFAHVSSPNQGVKSVKKASRLAGARTAAPG